MEKTAGVVYEEKDYGKFSYLKGNRTVEPYRKKKILDSINAVGWVKNPIVVNEKYQIIDGQGRFQVLQELGLPIQYVVAYGAGISECQHMNIGQSNWKPLDYIRSHAELGNQSYALLYKLIVENPDFAANEIIGVVYNRIMSHGHNTKAINSGKFTMTVEDYSITTATLEETRPFLPCIAKIPGSHRAMRTAIAWVLRNTSINKGRLLKKLEAQYPKMSPCVESTPLVFLSELSDVYNKGLAAKNCFYLDNEYKRFERENK